jgi:formamidopyrimidine-DNA glycosylase
MTLRLETLYSFPFTLYPQAMPELPEVETVKRGLERTIVGKTIESVDVRVPKLFADQQSLIDEVLIGQRVVTVGRRAKVLLIELANGWTLAIHLKMTGQLVVRSKKQEVSSTANASAHFSPLTSHSGFVGGHPEKAYDQELPHKHTHVIISFVDGSILYFNDLRKFGWMKLVASRLVASSQGIQGIDEFLLGFKHGPEPLEPAFTLMYFREFLKTRKTLIKSLLLDQSFIAGIGNIYADEALFAAAIKPTRRANSLSKVEVERLYTAIRSVLELGIEYGGTSFNSYRNVTGTAGEMRQHLKVYGREDQPCLRCGDAIVRQKIGQRSAHFCPNCQF